MLINSLAQCSKRLWVFSFLINILISLSHSTKVISKIIIIKKEPWQMQVIHFWSVIKMAFPPTLMYIRGKWLCSEELLILISLPLIGIYIIGYLGPDLWIIFHCGHLESVAGAPKEGRFSFPAPSLWTPWIIQERLERLWRMDLNHVFGADKFGSAGWVGDGCG